MFTIVSRECSGEFVKTDHAGSLDKRVEDLVSLCKELVEENVALQAQNSRLQFQQQNHLKRLTEISERVDGLICKSEE